MEARPEQFDEQPPWTVEDSSALYMIDRWGTGYFDVNAILHWRNAFRAMRLGSNQRTMVEMGLVGVVATQLWHHTYIDGTLADLPAWTPPAVDESPVFV